MTRSTEIKTKTSTVASNGQSQIKRSQSTPRVSSILKLNNSINNGISSNKKGTGSKSSNDKKSVTIIPNG